MVKFFTFKFLLLVVIAEVFAQDCTCALGSNTLTVSSGNTEIINAYYPGLVSAFSGATTLDLGAERANGLHGTIAPGDVLLVIQMQGVEIDATVPDGDANDPYGDGPGGNDRYGYLDTENFIAGQYEYVIASNTVGATGGSLVIKTALQNSYLSQTNSSNFSATQGRQTYQVVRVGNYSTVDIQSGGTVTGLPWNGTTGGIIAIDALTSLVLNGSFNADYLGFRGGYRRDEDSGGGDSKTSLFTSQNGIRGEGIAGTPLQVWGYDDAPLLSGTLTGTVLAETGYPGVEDSSTPNPRNGNPNNVIYNSYRGVGAAANAGGAGQGDGSGGGGSNGGFGGIGGLGFGDNSGRGGDELSLDLGARAFLGGGGGSGGFDNDTGVYLDEVASGQPGGGIIFIRANSLSGSGTISALGASASIQTAEGTGGGGAGGTLIVVTDTEDLSTLTIQADGGNGGSTLDDRDAGAGGGSGGNILLIRRGGAFSGSPTVTVSGGLGGTADGDPSGGAGDGGFETTSIPPPTTLDCSLINLPEASPGGVISDLRLWLNAGENVNFGGSLEVTGWQELSSNGFTLNNTVLVTGNTPDFTPSDQKFNGNPFITFNNEDVTKMDYLGFNNFTNFPMDNLTIFVVLNSSSTTGTQVPVSYFDGTENDLNVVLTNFANNAQSSISGNITNGNSAIRDGVTRVIMIDYENTVGANDQNRIFINNVLENTTIFDGGSLTQGGVFVLGQDIDNTSDGGFDAAEAFIGDIAEVIIYFNDLLTDEERQRVSSYLAIKYGVTLDQTSNQDYLNSIGEVIYPTSSNSLLFAGYDHDIAGVGRDDGSALDQRSSKSVNSDAILTGSVASFTADRQFLVWGNDGGFLTFDSNDVDGVNITQRLAREWRASLTNGLSNVKLSFDFSTGIANVPSSTENIVLLVDDDGIFASGNLQIISASSWDGTTAVFDNVTLPNESVFTVGIISGGPGGVSSGLTLWFRADMGTNTVVNGDVVTTWTGQSVNGTTLTSTAITPPGGEVGPTFNSSGANFNGNPSLTFTDSHLSATNFTFPNDNVTLFSVQNTTDTDFAGLFSYQTTNGDEFSIAQLSNLRLSVQGESQLTSSNIADGEPHILVSNFDDPTDAGNVFIDGNRIGANPTFTTAEGYGLSFLSGGLLTLGQETDNVTDGGFANDENYEGDIAEIILFSGVLSEADRTKVESYLAIKYGITLDQTTNQDYVSSNGTPVFPATSSLPDYISYSNDISGIGRDDQSGLNQRSSRSKNQDDIVTISISSFGLNVQYIVWGNDNDDKGLGSTVGTIEEVSSDLPSNVLTRLDREWRVRNTNNTGAVSVSFDLSGVTVTGTSVKDFNLLVDADGDFTDGFVQSIEASSFQNNVVTFNNVSLSSNNIFTLATSLVPKTPGGSGAATSLWLRTDVGVETTGSAVAVDGDQVFNWLDQSGNGQDAIDPSGLTIFEANEINGYPVVRFDGDATSLEGVITNATGNFTIFLVGDDSSSGDDASWFELKGQGLGNPGLHFYRTNYAGSAEFSTATQQGKPTLWTIDHAAGNSANIYENGALFEAGLTTTETATAGTYSLTLGDDHDGGNMLVGDMAELIIIDGTLSEAQRNSINCYLATKYGISLNNGDFDYVNADGTVVFPGNSSSAFSGYRNNIVGIGRNDAANFEQLSSSSVNPEAALQLTKTSAFIADEQYVFFGDNGLAINSSTASDYPSGTEGRIDRVWKVKKTNNPTGIFEIVLDATGLLISDPSDLRVIVDFDNGNFSNATILNPSVSQVGNEYTFTGLDLSSFPDESYFTLATVDESSTPLPLSWLSFDAVQVEQRVVMEWKTTNEINVSHFSIERSHNGADFVSIGELAAANITDAVNTYQFEDKTPLSEVNYYRIKQVDFDGRADYTNIVFVNMSGVHLSVDIYPNPAQDILMVSTSLPVAGRLRVKDLYGKVMMDLPFKSDSNSRIDISWLPPGIYLLEYSTLVGSYSMKLIKI